MFSDRRIILGALVVLIGLLVFAIAGPLSNAGFLHEDHEMHAYESHEHEAHAQHEAHERHKAREHARHERNADYDYVEIIDKTFKVEAGQTLFLDTDFGKVNVVGEGDDQVTVTITKGIDDVSKSRAEELFDRFEIDFDQNSDGVSVEGDYDGERNWGRGNRLHIEYEVTVPREFDVMVKTAGGSIMAAHFEGDAELRTSGGSVKAIEIDGPVMAKTSGGSITAEDLGGPADLHTSGGSITARDIDGAVDSHTSGGSITIEEAHGDVEARTSGGSIRLKEIHGIANAQTSGGSVSAELMEAPKSPMTLKTSGGTVTLHLTEDASIDIDAKASGGRVRTDMDVQVQGELSKTHLEGTINGGGPLVTLRSSGGSVKILKR